MRRWQVSGLAVLAALALACEGTGVADPGPSRSAGAGPASMAALGDSVTAGFGSCFALVICARRSWSTGSDPAVDSHYRRLRATHPQIRGNAHNFAEPGARAADLAGQARAAVAARADYVTVLIGANDACARRVEDMTGVATFRQRVDAGLRPLRRGLPRARVLVMSIPDLHRLWEVGHTEPRAVRAWNAGVCPSLLADPTAATAAAQRRRRQVAQRVDAYNRELAAACRAYGKRCRWDGGAVHRVRFGLDEVNHLDWFHPSVEGQARLAEVTWPG